jgi:tetratricopeptide (TPR) repeat protein
MPTDPGFAHALFSIVTGGSDTPILSHCLVGLFAAAAVIVAVTRLRVIHLPSGLLLGAFAALGCILAFSLAFTQYRATSLAAVGEWAVYLMAFLAAAALAGHGRGPRLLLGAVAAGCALMALAGLFEYATQPDPNWRIFSNWVNANALADILLMGFFCALALTLVEKDVTALAAGAATVFIGAALPLTQSRGGFIAAVLGLAVFCVGGLGGSLRRAPVEKEQPTRAGAGVIVAFSADVACACAVAAFLFPQSKIGHAPLAVGVALCAFLATFGGVRACKAVPTAAAGRIAVCFAAASLLFMVFFTGVSNRTARPGSGGGPAALARTSTASDQDREQSSEFRVLLWKGCLSEVRHDPAGTGLGTYRYYSTEPGLVQQTQLAHNTYLQLATEADPVAPVALLVALALWLWQMARGARRLPVATVPLRAGVVAAVCACAVHNVFESALYHFGIGFTFFLLLGVGLQLAADGLAPEFIPQGGRWAAGIAAVLAVAILAHIGYARLLASQGLGEVAQDPAAAHGMFDTACSLAPFDGDLWYCAAWAASTPEERLADLESAASFTPSPRFYRALAREQAQQHKEDGAIAALGEALREDPNNLPALLQLMRLYALQNDQTQAAGVARRLVAVETKPYMSVRAVPQIVPTETFEARVFLADLETDPNRQVALLRPAMDGWLAFLRSTYPQITAASAAGVKAGGGGTMETARKDLLDGKAVAERLSKLYRSLGRPADAAVADAADAAFAKALGGS